MAVLSMATFAQGGFKKKYFLANSVQSICEDVLEAPGGNLMMIGVTTDSLNYFSKKTLLGCDACGNVLWRKDYGKSKFQYIDNSSLGSSLKLSNSFYHPSIDLDSNNNAYLGVLLKFNYNGDTIWQKKFYSGTIGVNLYFYHTIKTIDGALLTISVLEDFNLNQRSILLLKTDLNGNELWRKKLTSPNTANPAWYGCRAVQDSATKKIIIVGYQYAGTNQTNSLVLITDSLGSKISQFSFSGSCGGLYGDIIQTQDKNFVVAGYKDACNWLGGLTPRWRGQIVKFSLTGVVIWSKEIDTLSIYNSNAGVLETTNGDLIISGDRDTCSNHGLNAYAPVRMVRMDANGNVKWKKYYGPAYSPNNSQGPRSMKMMNDGSYLLSTEFWLSPNVQPYSIMKIDSMGNDTLSVSCAFAGIKNNNLNEEETFFIFPNPASNEINLKVVTRPNEKYFVLIKDIEGRELRRLEIESYKEERLSTDCYDNGIYFIELLQHEKPIAMKRLVIIK